MGIITIRSRKIYVNQQYFTKACLSHMHHESEIKKLKLYKDKKYEIAIYFCYLSTFFIYVHMYMYILLENKGSTFFKGFFVNQALAKRKIRKKS